MGQTAAYYFTALLVILDPVGTAALFIGLTRGTSAAHQRRMAIKGVTIAAAVLLGFAFAGEFLLRALGIGLPAFRIAGGCLLFLVAVDMLLAGQHFRQITESETREAGKSEDISVFPLAIPLIAGPGALTTMVLLMGQSNDEPARQGLLIGILIAVLLITFVLLTAAARVVALLGQTGVNVISRIFGILLAGLAMQLILDGISTGLRFAPS